MKDKLKNYGFWLSLAGAIVIFLQAVGIRIDAPYINEIITAFMGILVVLGIISNPSSGKGYKD